ncbi:Cysteine protease atg4b [Lunasporangiospora selenospora]|uniref:Autophagy-related protein 4 n=1 Tax=Lunasporangiospora selenospora TaxID=979761 RepID=A0A9P6FRG6_9FUNG|nr:Cysteine protease atg4b [Lunasporangiospora selenospora]
MHTPSPPAPFQPPRRNPRPGYSRSRSHQARNLHVGSSWTVPGQRQGTLASNHLSGNDSNSYDVADGRRECGERAGGSPASFTPSNTDDRPRPRIAHGSDDVEFWSSLYWQHPVHSRQSHESGSPENRAVSPSPTLTAFSISRGTRTTDSHARIKVWQVLTKTETAPAPDSPESLAQSLPHPAFSGPSRRLQQGQSSRSFRFERLPIRVPHSSAAAFSPDGQPFSLVFFFTVETTDPSVNRRTKPSSPALSPSHASTTHPVTLWYLESVFTRSRTTHEHMELMGTFTPSDPQDPSSFYIYETHILNIVQPPTSPSQPWGIRDSSNNNVIQEDTVLDFHVQSPDGVIYAEFSYTLRQETNPKDRPHKHGNPIVSKNHHRHDSHPSQLLPSSPPSPSDSIPFSDTRRTATLRSSSPRSSSPRSPSPRSHFSSNTFPKPSPLRNESRPSSPSDKLDDAEEYMPVSPAAVPRSFVDPPASQPSWLEEEQRSKERAFDLNTEEPDAGEHFMQATSEFFSKMGYWLYNSRVVQYITRDDRVRTKMEFGKEDIWMLGACYRFPLGEEDSYGTNKQIYSTMKELATRSSRATTVAIDIQGQVKGRAPGSAPALCRSFTDVQSKKVQSSGSFSEYIPSRASPSSANSLESKYPLRSQTTSSLSCDEARSHLNLRSPPPSQVGHRSSSAQDALLLSEEESTTNRTTIQKHHQVSLLHSEEHQAQDLEVHGLVRTASPEPCQSQEPLSGSSHQFERKSPRRRMTFTELFSSETSPGQPKRPHATSISTLKGIVDLNGAAVGRSLSGGVSNGRGVTRNGVADVFPSSKGSIGADSGARPSNLLEAVPIPTVTSKHSLRLTNGMRLSSVEEIKPNALQSSNQGDSLNTADRHSTRGLTQLEQPQGVFSSEPTTFVHDEENGQGAGPTVVRERKRKTAKAAMVIKKPVTLEETLVSRPVLQEELIESPVAPPPLPPSATFPRPKSSPYQPASPTKSESVLRRSLRSLSLTFSSRAPTFGFGTSAPSSVPSTDMSEDSRDTTLDSQFASSLDGMSLSTSLSSSLSSTISAAFLPSRLTTGRSNTVSVMGDRDVRAIYGSHRDADMMTADRFEDRHKRGHRGEAISLPPWVTTMLSRQLGLELPEEDSQYSPEEDIDCEGGSEETIDHDHHEWNDGESGLLDKDFGSESGTLRLSRRQEILKMFMMDFQSQIWFTYRKYLTRIEPSFYTCDAGWGCMMRTGQSLLAQAFVQIMLGREWRAHHPQPVKTNRLYSEILEWFADEPNHYYSIHGIAKAGLLLDKRVGEWFGPSTVAHALKRLSKKHTNCPLKILISMDGTLRMSAILEAAQTFELPKVLEPTTVTDWKPVLIFVPTRFGLDKLTERYVPNLKKLFQLPQFLGIAGGRPGRSLYFVACQGNELFYYDPHFVKPRATPEEIFSCPSPSYHCPVVRSMHILELDPSMLLAFLIRSPSELKDWMVRLARDMDRSYPLITLVDDSLDPTPRNSFAHPPPQSQRTAYTKVKLSRDNQVLHSAKESGKARPAASHFSVGPGSNSMTASTNGVDDHDDGLDDEEGEFLLVEG